MNRPSEKSETIDLTAVYIKSGDLIDLVLIDAGGNEYITQLPALQSTIENSFAKKFVEFKLLLSEVKQPFSFCKVITKRRDIILTEEQFDEINLCPGDSFEITVNLRWDHL